MTALPSPTSLHDRNARIADDLDVCRQLMMEVAQMGMERLRRLHGEAMAQGEEKPVAGQPAAIEAAERGLRRTVLLVRHLAEPPVARANGQPSRMGTRKRIIRGVEDRIVSAVKDEGHREHLRGEMLERLDSLDFEEDMAERQVEDLVTDICNDMGVPAPVKIYQFKRRTPADLVALRAIAEMAPGTLAPAPPQPRRTPKPTAEDLVADLRAREGGLSLSPEHEGELGAMLLRASRLRPA